MEWRTLGGTRESTGCEGSRGKGSSCPQEGRKVTKTNASSAANGNCNWQVLRIDGPSGGNCAACGLPYWNQPAYRIPGVKGWLSSILCAESILFGVGCCRWCGAKLNGQAHQRFCSDECAKRS